MSNRSRAYAAMAILVSLPACDPDTTTDGSGGGSSTNSSATPASTGASTSVSTTGVGGAASSTSSSSTTTNASSTTGPEPCAEVFQGSFTIQNTFDVDMIAPYCEITGDLFLDAAGMTTIALPALRTIGGK